MQKRTLHPAPKARPLACDYHNQAQRTVLRYKVFISQSATRESHMPPGLKHSKGFRSHLKLNRLLYYWLPYEGYHSCRAIQTQWELSIPREAAPSRGSLSWAECCTKSQGVWIVLICTYNYKPAACNPISIITSPSKQQWHATTHSLESCLCRHTPWETHRNNPSAFRRSLQTDYPSKYK